MDDITEGAIYARFDSLCEFIPSNGIAICNFMKGYLSALYDCNAITQEEFFRALDDVDEWLKEEVYALVDD